jgi:hypothetical protein
VPHPGPLQLSSSSSSTGGLVAGVQQDSMHAGSTQPRMLALGLGRAVSERRRTLIEER